jgi:hypothetical protein
MKKTMPTSKEKIALWYAGLGKAFHASRGPMGALGCYDSTKLRKIAYLGLSSILIVLTAVCLSAAWIIKEVIWLAALCGLVALWALITAISFLRAFSALSKALATDSNPDLLDPVRIKAIQKAYQWGLKKNYIRRDPSGKEFFSK